MTTREVTGARLPWDAADPYPYYERRRHEGDVVWDETIGSWLVLGYQPARQILGGAGWTSNPLANPNAPAATRATDPDILRRNMLLTDGQDHKRLRHSVRDVFTRVFISELGEGIETLAAETIDMLPARVDFDFMAEVALPLPIAVAAAWLGLDVEAARLLREESLPISRMLGDFNDAEAAEAGMAAFATLLTEFLPLGRRSSRSPWRRSAQLHRR